MARELELEIETLAESCGAVRTAWFDPREIKTDSGFRVSCAMNQCGAYNARWSCPPVLPEVSVMCEELLKYDIGMLFQADYPIGDDFDYEAMEEGALKFYGLCRCLEGKLAELPAHTLVLGAGACRECHKCTYPERPCVRPQGPVMSLEAYGIDVTALCQMTYLPYNVNPDLATYTGAVLIQPDSSAG